MAFWGPIIGGLLGLGGALLGSNATNNAANQASNAANQASSGENQLIQEGMLPILNSLLGSWNQYYSPYQGEVGQQVSGGLSGLNYPGLLQNAALGLSGPGGAQAVTGIPGYQTLANAVNYLSNPAGFLSGMRGVGGLTLSQLESPTTQMGMLPGYEGGLGGLEGASMGQSPAGANYGNFGGALTGAANASLSPSALSQLYPGLVSGLGASSNAALNPSIAQNMFPGFQQAMNQLTGQSLAPSAMSEMMPGYLNANQQYQAGSVAPTALQAVMPGFAQFYGQQAENGLSPQSIGAAENTNANLQAQNFANLRNQLGSALPNIAGTTRDLAFQNAENNAQLGSNLAGQNQALQGAGEQALYAGAQGLDTQRLAQIAQASGLNQEALGAGQALSGLNLQQLQQGAGLQQALQNAGMGLSGLNLQQLQQYQQGLGEMGGLGSQLSNLNLNQLQQYAAMQQALQSGALNLGQFQQGQIGQTAGLMGQGFQAGGTVDQQALQRELEAQQLAGGIDRQTQNALTNASQMSNAAQQQYLQNILGASGLGQNALTDLMNYIGQGRAMLPGIASQFGNLAGMYGQAAGNAANNAFNIQANAPNPFTGLLNGAMMGGQFMNMYGGYGGYPGYGSNPNYYGNPTGSLNF